MNVEKKVQEANDKAKATTGLVSVEDMERMRVLWKKGRNMFSAFFTELDAVRQQVGDNELFASWCFFQLGIGVNTLNDVAIALKRDDTDRVRNDLAAAKQAENDRLAAERHARKLEKIERDNELARKRAENAEVKAARAAEKKATEKAQTKVETKRRRAEKAAREGDPVTRAKTAILANPIAKRDDICATAEVSHAVEKEARAVLEAEGKIEPRIKASNDVALDDQYRATANVVPIREAK